MQTIIKSAKIESSSVSDSELAEINGKYALKSLSADEIFCFKMAICDNQVDRDHECFSDNAIATLAKLFVGKTIISDHTPSAKNQCARIYATNIESNGTVKRLIAKCYTVITESTKDFITMLSAGIMKEVSVSCRMKSAICSVCGINNVESYCRHVPGREYDNKRCHFILDDPEDAFEVSFVAVPAQKEAGVIKSYGGEPMRDTEESDNEDTDENEEKEKMLNIEIALAKAAISISENEEDKNHD